MNSDPGRPRGHPGLANSALAQHYQSFPQHRGAGSHRGARHQQAAAALGSTTAMAIFFLLVGPKSNGEMLEGALIPGAGHLPGHCRRGGMLAPCAHLQLLQLRRPGDPGWLGHPAATDIAFALGVMALLGKRVPTISAVFLLALAIMDDLGVIVIIALFYTQQLSLSALAIGVATSGPCCG